MRAQNLFSEVVVGETHKVNLVELLLKGDGVEAEVHIDFNVPGPAPAVLTCPRETLFSILSPKSGSGWNAQGRRHRERCLHRDETHQAGQVERLHPHPMEAPIRVL